MLTIMAPLAQFLATEGIEGIRLQTYDDKTGDRLDAGETAEGTASIAVGLIEYADGSPVEPGDELTLQEAWDETYHYLNKVLTPALERLISVNLPDHKLMAFSSWLYNFGETKARRYSLPKLINSGADDRAIIEKWMEYINAGGKPELGLYRRRMAEVLMWMDLDWRPALNVTFDDSIFDVITELGGEVPEADTDLFEEPEIPRQGAPVTKDMSDPTPETAMTMDDRQYLSARAAGYDDSFDEFMGHRTIVSAKNAITAPNVDPRRAPKPMEDSKTFSGLSKKESGKEAIQWSAVLSGAAGTAGVVKGLTKDTAGTVEAAQPLVAGFTVNHLIIIGLAIGIPLAIVGIYRMMRGDYLAKDGRAEGVQPKI